MCVPAGARPVLDLPQLQPASARLPALPPHHGCALCLCGAFLCLNSSAVGLVTAATVAADPDPAMVQLHSALPIFRLVGVPLPALLPQPTWTRAAPCVIEEHCSFLCASACISLIVPTEFPSLPSCHSQHGPELPGCNRGGPAARRPRVHHLPRGADRPGWVHAGTDARGRLQQVECSAMPQRLFARTPPATAPLPRQCRLRQAAGPC